MQAGAAYMEYMPGLVVPGEDSEGLHQRQENKPAKVPQDLQVQAEGINIHVLMTEQQKKEMTIDEDISSDHIYKKVEKHQEVNQKVKKT